MSRTEVLKTLRRAGLEDLAELVEHSLPDPVDLREVQSLLAEHGVSRGFLEDLMGGSP